LASEKGANSLPIPGTRLRERHFSPITKTVLAWVICSLSGTDAVMIGYGSRRFFFSSIRLARAASVARDSRSRLSATKRA